MTEVGGLQEAAPVLSRPRGSQLLKREALHLSNQGFQKSIASGCQLPLDLFQCTNLHGNFGVHKRMRDEGDFFACCKMGSS